MVGNSGGCAAASHPPAHRPSHSRCNRKNARDRERCHNKAPPPSSRSSLRIARVCSDHLAINEVVASTAHHRRQWGTDRDWAGAIRATGSTALVRHPEGPHRKGLRTRRSPTQSQPPSRRSLAPQWFRSLQPINTFLAMHQERMAMSTTMRAQKTGHTSTPTPRWCRPFPSPGAIGRCGHAGSPSRAQSPASASPSPAAVAARGHRRGRPS